MAHSYQDFVMIFRRVEIITGEGGGQQQKRRHGVQGSCLYPEKGKDGEGKLLCLK